MTETAQKTSLAVILLAAGPSSRLGESKQLVEFRGECLVRRAARLALGLEPERLIVVTGCEAQQVAARLENLPVETVFNRDWASGMGASIAAGARALSRSADGVLLMVCDQWQLRGADLDRLVERWRTQPQRIVLACWREGRAFVTGPPVIFPTRLLQELKAIPPDRGARQVIDQHMDDVEFVELPNAAEDLDRPEDLEALRARD
ncbi:MAG: nucleotidyltransferase family protein [Xanthomonadales bacterium]